MNTSYNEPNYTTITGPCNKIGKSIRRNTKDNSVIQANPAMNAHGNVKLMPLGLRWMFGWVWVLYSPRWKR